MTSQNKIGIVDYRGGNLRSVVNALKTLGYPYELIQDANIPSSVESILFPGQGSFRDCLQALKRFSLYDCLQDWIRQDRPYFGICIGYQLLFETSEEAEHIKGFSICSGSVKAFKNLPSSDLNEKIPHMGWNEVHQTDPTHFLWKQIPQNSHYYFVHSYYPEPLDTNALCTTDYLKPFASGISMGKVHGTQFHPEKSGSIGLQLIDNFITQYRS